MRGRWQDHPIEPLTGRQPGAGVAARRLCRRRDAGDHLDFEVEASEPVDAEGGPARIGRRGEDLLLGGHDGFELVLGIGVEAGDVDDVVEAAARRLERRLQVGESPFDLACEIRLGAPVGAAAYMTGHEKQIAGTDCRRIAMGLVEGVAAGGQPHTLGDVDRHLDTKLVALVRVSPTAGLWTPALGAYTPEVDRSKNALQTASTGTLGTTSRNCSPLAWLKIGRVRLHPEAAKLSRCPQT